VNSTVVRPPHSADVFVREMHSEDVPSVITLLNEGPTATGWSAGSLAREVQSGAAWVAVQSEEIVGFVVGRVAADECEILNIAVERTRRRRGIGTQLLLAALGLAKSHGCGRVYLEVRQSNISAISLYSRHGFSECGRRPSYYRSPVEDAVLLRADLHSRA